MKLLAAADGRVIAMFKFEPGFVGGTHSHDEAEFSYVLEGEIVSNGVAMAADGFGKEGAGVRLVDLSPSINFFTVSDILG